jgi:hypothetical protein
MGINQCSAANMGRFWKELGIEKILHRPNPSLLPPVFGYPKR